jgi:MSHA pilin protein MshD
MVAIAESLLEEVQLMSFTYCDPNDANVLTATGTAGCALAANAEGPTTSPQALELRGSPNTPFNNVWDYRALSMTGIQDMTANAIAGLAGYSATVSVADSALGNIPQGTAGAPGAAALITVTVSAPSGDSIRLDGYRTRYAPNSP